MTADVLIRSEAGAGSGRAVRSQGIEALRIIAAYGIVAFHAGLAFPDIAYSGLIVFLILAPAADLYFNFDRVRSARQLARLLLLPYAFWWCVYGAFNLVTHKPFIASAEWSNVLLGGTSTHLWFLPFIFLVLVLLNRMKQHIRPAILLWVATVTASVLLVSAAMWRAPSSLWNLPFPQWLHAVPAICIGVVLGLSRKLGRRVILPTMVVAGAVLWALVSHQPGVGVSYAIGTPLAAVAMLSLGHGRWKMANVQPVADCMLGVYLTHVLWLQVVYYIFRRNDVGTVTLTFALALTSVYAARRLVPFSRRVLG